MDKFLAIIALALLAWGTNAAQAAGPVVADDGTTKCTGYNSMAFEASGKVTIAGCTGGAAVTTGFSIAAANTATAGTALPITVTRASTGGDATLNLSSSISALFTPATLNFTAADSAMASSVTFLATGSAVLSALSNGATVASSAPIGVGATEVVNCAGGGASVDLGILPQGTGRTFGVARGSVLSLKFKIPDGFAGTFSFSYETSTYGSHNNKETAFSVCPGDFTGKGMTAPFRVASADWSGGAVSTKEVTNPANKGVLVSAGKTYYMNIRGVSGTDEGFVLGVAQENVQGGGQSASCAGIARPAYISLLPGMLNPVEGIGGGAHLVPVSGSDSYATGAFSFTVPATPPVEGTYTFNFADSKGGNLGKEVNVSQCPGDFNTRCLANLQYSSDPFFFSPVATAASACSVVLGKTYYLNIRSKFKGAAMSFVLNVLP